MAWSLEAEAGERGTGWLGGTPVVLLVALAAALAACAMLAARGWLPRAALGAAAVTAGHGALIATALAWTARDDADAWDPRRATAVALVLIAAGASLAASARHGAFGHLLLPVAGLVLIRRGRLAGVGLESRPPLRAVVVGAGVGAFLGAHLLLSASLTHGHGLRGDGLVAWLAAVSYDAGLNVVSSELLFRGALLRRALARWPLAPAIALSTGASLARYLVDPLLPGAVETVVGAVAYLTLLGVASAWLAWWSASVAPAMAASLAFFAAYRLVSVG